MLYAALTDVWRNLYERRIGRHKRRLDRARRNMRDRVEISAEAVYRFAAQEFDPRRITPADAKALIELLFEGGAIERQDRRAMRRTLRELHKSAKNWRSGARTTDLIQALESMAGRVRGKTVRDAERIRTLAILRLVACRRP